MAKEKKVFTARQPDKAENVEEVLTRTEQFIEQNQKKLTTAATVIIVLIAAVFFLNRFYLKPREANAQAEMFTAQNFMITDSFRLALQGDGISYLGFLDIIDEYPFTKASNLAHYYAGQCYLKMGQYEDAIEQFKKFSLKSPLITPMCLGNTGDAYVELGNLEEGASYYMKAADKSSNDLTTPIFLMKAGKTFEQLNDFENALKAYKRIQLEFSKSMQARMIDKYIARAEAKLTK